jgi:hypothetical protein
MACQYKRCAHGAQRQECLELLDSAIEVTCVEIYQCPSSKQIFLQHFVNAGLLQCSSAGTDTLLEIHLRALEL